MSAADAAVHHGERTGLRLPARRFGDFTIATVVFLGGFVMIEPAPYELLLVAAAAIWFAGGLRLNRHLAPLIVLLLVYVAGGFLSLTQVEAPLGRPFVYMMTSALLAFSGMFLAAAIGESPERRFAAVRHAYVASAALVAVIGVLAYFDAIPFAEAFKLYSRAKGTFKDPNVFGPFLVLPLALIARDILTRPLRRSLWQIGLFPVLFIAIFLSFSRAAWGLAVVALLLTATLAFVGEPLQRARLRLGGYFIAGSAAVVLMLAAAISVPAVSGLFAERAQVVQDYDASPTGRFERQLTGALLVPEAPLGIGPYVFGERYGEDEHNTWLKGFTVYGWLGGFAYAILAAWTVAAAAPLLLRRRSWQPLLQCTFAVFVGHLLIHSVIDANHWRHLFLLYAILWAAIAVEKGRERVSVAAEAIAAVAPVPRAPLPRRNGPAVERARVLATQ